MLWRQIGIILPRDARQQCDDAACCPVEWENLMPGNLIFYGSCETDIRHVGLYMGENTLLHASVKPIPIVQQSFLDEPSLRQRFAYQTARRVLDVYL
jgi:cell wall-associated NlpC family hydrolase